jgi:hypothetical protein
LINDKAKIVFLLINILQYKFWLKPIPYSNLHISPAKVGGNSTDIATELDEILYKTIFSLDINFD